MISAYLTSGEIRWDGAITRRTELPVVIPASYRIPGVPIHFQDSQIFPSDRYRICKKGHCSPSSPGRSTPFHCHAEIFIRRPSNPLHERAVSFPLPPTLSFLLVSHSTINMSKTNSGKAPSLVVVEPQPMDLDSDSQSRQLPESADPDPSSTVENGTSIDNPSVDDHEGDLITVAEVSRLKRGLAERHLSMLGIAGAIGTGLFLSLGGAIQTGGPLGALLGYAMVGGIVCAVQFALGEVTALLPVRPPLFLAFAPNRQRR